MKNTIQRELDLAEEYVLTKLFGDSSTITINGNIKLIATLAKVNIEETINKWIEMFETFSKAYMTEDGYYKGESITELLESLTGIKGFNIPSFKPIDIAVTLDKIINLEGLGHFIQK